MCMQIILLPAQIFAHVYTCKYIYTYIYSKGRLTSTQYNMCLSYVIGMVNESAGAKSIQCQTLLDYDGLKTYVGCKDILETMLGVKT
jgi:hypothetical protein